jgi:hypothetical protein
MSNDTYIPHECLSEDIQKEIEDGGVVRRVYLCSSTDNKFFVYLDNGACITREIKHKH